MAEAFVRTLKRDYARVSHKPDARAVIDQLPSWFNHYNEVHPHSALGYRSPASSSLAQPKRTCQAFRGQQHSLKFGRKRHSISCERLCTGHLDILKFCKIGQLGAIVGRQLGRDSSQHLHGDI